MSGGLNTGYLGTRQRATPVKPLSSWSTFIADPGRLLPFTLDQVNESCTATPASPRPTRPRAGIRAQTGIRVRTEVWSRGGTGSRADVWARDPNQNSKHSHDMIQVYT
ncbi:hypothetical protein G3M48_004474 [Beauveria asiatica]|uniref:Uncharacterized protein n=1 Tax=Beauveria asiatica TaxID=1069075 RepID=A0AAW0RTD2_9HYPO